MKIGFDNEKYLDVYKRQTISRCRCSRIWHGVGRQED